MFLKVLCILLLFLQIIHQLEDGFAHSSSSNKTSNSLQQALQNLDYFSREYYTITHLQKHSEVKSFQGKFCQRSFSHYSSLAKHERIHTRKEPYNCETCNSLFGHASTLYNHMLTHTFDRPYKCKKTFSYSIRRKTL